jgi:hypothetical protein
VDKSICGYLSSFFLKDQILYSFHSSLCFSFQRAVSHILELLSIKAGNSNAHLLVVFLPLVAALNSSLCLTRSSLSLILKVMSLLVKPASRRSLPPIPWDGKNFHIWKWRVETTLSQHALKFMLEDPGVAYANLPRVSLERYATSDERTSIKPDDQDAKLDDPDAKLFRYDHARIAERLSREVGAWLSLSMPNPLVHLVAAIPDGQPHVVWKALLDEFQRDTMSSRLALRRQLHNSELGNQDFSEYIANIRSLTNLTPSASGGWEITSTILPS